MKRIFIVLFTLLLAFSLVACSVGKAQLSVTTPSIVPPPPVVQSTDISSKKATEEPVSPESTPEAGVPKEDTINSMQITIGDTSFSATLVKNAAANAFVELLRNAPVIINMSDYSGFEKVGLLGTSLPTDNSSITTSEGDIVLYNGNQIVVFYDTHSWDYTRIAKIDDLTKWKETLGDGDVTITFSIA